MPRYGGFRIGGKTVRVSRRHQGGSGGSDGVCLTSRSPRIARTPESRECSKCRGSYDPGDYAWHKQTSWHTAALANDAARTCAKCGASYEAGAYGSHAATPEHRASLKAARSASAEDDLATRYDFPAKCPFCEVEVPAYIAHVRTCSVRLQRTDEIRGRLGL